MVEWYNIGQTSESPPVGIVECLYTQEGYCQTIHPESIYTYWSVVPVSKQMGAVWTECGIN